MNFLFEISWDFGSCANQIAKTIENKSLLSEQTYRNRYFIVSPCLPTHPPLFKAVINEHFSNIQAALEKRGLICQIGYWNIPCKPTVILVNFQNRHNPEQLLFEYWQNYQVDSITGQWDYIEPVIFGTACAEVVETVFEELAKPGDNAIAHIHQWTAGAALLRLKKSCKKVATVYTNYSTVVGKALTNDGRNIFEELIEIDPDQTATSYSAAAKHSMESACAREADQFTTVSELVSQESSAVFKGKPPKVLPLRIAAAKQSNTSEILKLRQFLINFAQRLWDVDFDNSTKLWAAVSDDSFVSAGFDILLESMALLDQELRQQQSSKTVLFVLLPAERGEIDEACRSKLYTQNNAHSHSPIYTTHKNNNPTVTSIINSCQQIGLNNSSDNHCFIVIVPATLNGWDGVFNRTYNELLPAFELAIFPDLYQPVGHFALDSAAHGVPLILSDLNSWGAELEALPTNEHKGISLLQRHNRSRDAVITDLHSLLVMFAACDLKKQQNLAKSAAKTAGQYDMEKLSQEHKAIYKSAIARAKKRNC